MLIAASAQIWHVPLDIQISLMFRFCTVLSSNYLEACAISFVVVCSIFQDSSLPIVSVQLRPQLTMNVGA